MGYIGVQPTDTYLSIASQQITGDGGATYTLDYSVSNEEDVAVFVNNVRQNVSTYTVSGTSLTLGGTISASDSCWVLFLGRTVGTKTPAVGSVTNDMLAGSIATSKLADGSTFATTNGITMADQWRLSADTNTGTNADVTSNWERVDNTGWGGIGTGLTESSGIFTFPSTGIYLIMFSASMQVDNGDVNAEMRLLITTDNSSYAEASAPTSGNQGSADVNASQSAQFLFDVTDTSTHKFKFDTNSFATSNRLRGDTTVNETHFTVVRLGDT